MVLEFPILADYALFSVEGKTLYATHGHIFNQDNLPPMQEGDILIHGHTHLLKAEETEGRLRQDQGVKSRFRVHSQGRKSAYIWYFGGRRIYHPYTGR